MSRTKQTRAAFSPIKTALMAGTSFTMLAMMAPTAFAQAAEDTVEGTEIIVTGTRQTIQDSIKLKRNSVQIVDGLSSDEIGDLPALSIGEALEVVAGVAGHRENGGATEVSIRGLGPYLSSTVFNGRQATNGSGDRSVNFSQFPSELLNKLAVFKTQDASQIEGGVAGQVQIETLKPLKYGKQRFQFNLKGNVNPYQLDQSDTVAGDIGFRGTVSYVDQYETNSLGDIGISIGGQISDISQPENEQRTSSPANTKACLLTNGLAQYTDQTNGGTFTGFSNNPETNDRGEDDCDDFNDRRNSANEGTRGSDTEGYDTSDNGSGVAIDDGTDFGFVTSSRSYRKNDSNDKRDSLFGTVQWQPNEQWDIALDGQFSERTLAEIRNDIGFTDQKQNDISLDIGNGETTTTFDSLDVSPSGSIRRSITESPIQILGTDFERVETYLGGGLGVSYDATDRLTLSADVSYSNTERTESERQFLFQSGSLTGGTNVVTAYDNTGDVAQFVLSGREFDVNDHSNYLERLQVRLDEDRSRENTIKAGRFDVDYDLDRNIFTTLKAGVRFSSQDYLELQGGSDSTGGRKSFKIENDGEFYTQNNRIVDLPSGSRDPNWEAIIQETNEACRTDFNHSNFLGNLRDGALITNIADDRSVISATNTFATFDPKCVINTATDRVNFYLDDINDDLRSGQPLLTPFNTDNPVLTRERQDTIDVTEDVLALYAMTNYETQMRGYPVRGNVGVRVVKTDVNVTGYRNAFLVDEVVDPDTEESAFTLNILPEIETINQTHDYLEVLPSITAIVDLNDNALLRFGAFRAMSRADPANMGFNRRFADITDDAPTREDLVGRVTGSGNPQFDPLMSWNFDAGYEYYPDPDSILAISVYHKSFQGGFENVRQRENFNIDGVQVPLVVSTQQTSEDKSKITGVELTASHRFSYLPGYWSGLGMKASYNYADSDFEIEDKTYGDRFIRDVDGTVTQTGFGIVPPSSIAGLSENVFSGQVYYQIGGFDVQAIYKYRDEYYHPSITDGGSIRYVGDTGTAELRTTYKINKNFKVSMEALNLFSEQKEQFSFVRDNRYEVNDFGPRVFFGIQGRF